MPHLELERLAALDEDAPSSDELTHLASCVTCRQEREAFTRLATLAFAEREVAAGPEVMPAPRLTEWGPLSAQLREAGLLTQAVALAAETPLHDRAGRDHRTIVRRGFNVRSLARAAAAVLLLVSGAAIGRVSAGGSLTGARSLAAGAAAGELTETTYRSTAEASLALEQAQREYQLASMWLASHDTTVNAQAVYRARLAALDQMMTASRAGLYEAPQDPMLNQYYLAAYTAREATLRQLGAALPVDRVMERF